MRKRILTTACEQAIRTLRIQRRVPLGPKLGLKSEWVVSCSKQGRQKQMEVTNMSDEIIETVEETVEPAAPAADITMADVVRDPNAPVITLKKCLEAGAHFGHQTRRWNPKMGKFIYGARNGIYIIDLEKTVERTIASYKALRTIVESGGRVLFVGTKPQAQQVVIDEAVRSGSFYITNRWLGGTLTNFRTINARIKRLKDLETQQADGTWDRLPKKEVALLKKEFAKLNRNLGGIKEMRKLPQALILVDPEVEHNAVAEANKLRIPVFALCDTSDDPDSIDFPIPTNNDAISSIQLLLGVLADAIVEARTDISFTKIAYTKDDGEATMADAIRVADIAAEQRRAQIRAARKAREERLAKIQAERQARFAARKAAKENASKAEAKPEEEAPAAEKEAE